MLESWSSSSGTCSLTREVSEAMLAGSWRSLLFVMNSSTRAVRPPIASGSSSSRLSFSPSLRCTQHAQLQEYGLNVCSMRGAAKVRRELGRARSGGF